MDSFQKQWYVVTGETWIYPVARRKLMCHRGHPRTPENLTRRMCRTCDRARPRKASHRATSATPPRT